MSKYKKTGIIYIVSILIAFAFSYLCFSFVQADFNAMNWSAVTRAAYVVSIVFILILSVPLTGMFLDEI